MRLLADQNIQKATVLFLRELGHDVCWTDEEGLRTVDDDTIFAHAQRTQRTLLTYDCDFVDLRELSSKQHFGVIRLRISNQRVAYMHPVLGAALQQIRDLDLMDSLITVTDKRVRVRTTTLG
jgi:predicted nuclease of predicted toxin-antitoxin system